MLTWPQSDSQPKPLDTPKHIAAGVADAERATARCLFSRTSADVAAALSSIGMAHMARSISGQVLAVNAGDPAG